MVKSTYLIQKGVDQAFVFELIKNFNVSGQLFDDRKRNKIKIFESEGQQVNVKSFKIPNFINKLVYRYFRDSKAKRSFLFANKLLALGIGTPKPLAYFEYTTFFGLLDSYYISEHLAVDLTFRELVEIPDYPNHATILQQFMHFCYDLHEKGIEFLDHSPGNTLIVQTAPGQYQFYLVDLNRMQFHTHMPFEMRMKNLSRLTPKKEMVEQMGAFYAEKYLEKSTDEIVERLWFYTHEFQEAFARKIRVKQQIKFWK
jgi:hypothetical protein